MLLYILKSIFCLFLFLGFYHLVLEKEKMHRFNRFYLLGSIVLAFLIPSFTITVITPTEFIEPVVQEFQLTEQIQTSDIAFVEETEINYMNYVYGLYIIVSGILCFFFIKNLLKILSKTKKNEKVSYYDATVILLKEKILPHTFLKYIFINKNEYTNDQQEQLILTHELAHVQQKHSIDVLFVELLQIVFWFIPIFKLYKKAIQLNHEFLADDAVLKQHKNISEYQHILINTSAQNNNIYLASNLNYSLTKKRLLMMTTPSSKTKILLKKLLVIPLTAGFIFAFAQRVEAQENKNEPQIVKVNNEYNNDLMAVRVEESRTSYNGIMYSYTIKNNGKKDVSSMDYSVVFKVDNKIVNFNDALPNLNSGETFKNGSGYTFYSNLKRNNTTKDFDDIKPRASINYSLEIIYNDSNIKNNTINGVSIFNEKKAQINKQENGISKQEMQEYKTLFNSAKSSKIYKQKNVQRMISLYKRMSKKQQESVTDIRKVVPPPPPKMDIVYTYKRLAARIQRTSKNKKANVIYLKELYRKMTPNQKKQVVKPSKILPPPPPKPVKIEVIEKKTKKSKPQIKEIEVVEIPEIIEVEEKEELVEVEEVIEVREIIEIKEDIEEKEIEEVIEVREVFEVEEIIESPEIVEQKIVKSPKPIEVEKIIKYELKRKEKNVVSETPWFQITPSIKHYFIPLTFLSNHSEKNLNKFKIKYAKWLKQYESQLLKIKNHSPINSDIEFFRYMKKRNAKFLYNKKKVSYKKIMKIYNENKISFIYSLELPDKTIKVFTTNKKR